LKYYIENIQILQKCFAFFQYVIKSLRDLITYIILPIGVIKVNLNILRKDDMIENV